MGTAVLLTAATLGACSSSGEDTSSAEPAATGDGVLADVCPEKVVIQADWEPEAEHGGIYELIGDDYAIDAEAKAVSGPLLSDGEDTGVAVEIRIGGAPVGYQSAQSLLYQDRDILLGYGRTSEYMITQEDTPVTAVLSTMEKSPYAIYWDPATYPDAKAIKDLKAAGTTISVGPESSVWVDYLIGTGQVEESQLDRSDQNKPAMFVAANGDLAEAGFITAEPFMYENEIAEWGKPVIGELIADAGYPEYFQAIVARTDDIEAEADCLKALVPIMQQAQADYIADPTGTNELIVELAETYDTGWVYSAEGAEFAHAAGIEKGIMADGADGTMGSFDTERVQELIDIVGEYSDADVSSTTPDSLVTNEFLDPSISAKG
ncbi:MAG: hypothetical protein M3Y51_00030 [Actinomycetota bacterium]|nr:hypothetical protein [Actinomycetota bacterium]